MHLYCEESECLTCEQGRKTFTFASHYVEYHKTIFFSDKEGAQKIVKGRPCPTVAAFDQNTWDHAKCDIIIQANLWKFSEEADCRTRGCKWVPSGQSLRQQLLPIRSRSLVVSSIDDDDQWAEIASAYRKGHDPPTVQNDARFHDDDEQDFWGDNQHGNVMMDIRQRIQQGEKPRKKLEFWSLADNEQWYQMTIFCPDYCSCDNL